MGHSNSVCCGFVIPGCHFVSRLITLEAVLLRSLLRGLMQRHRDSAGIQFNDVVRGRCQSPVGRFVADKVSSHGQLFSIAPANVGGSQSEYSHVQWSSARFAITGRSSRRRFAFLHGQHRCFGTGSALCGHCHARCFCHNLAAKCARIQSSSAGSAVAPQSH